jgi:hypothetical protein
MRYNAENNHALSETISELFRRIRKTAKRDYHWTDFKEIWHFDDFSKICRQKFTFD